MASLTAAIKIQSITIMKKQLTGSLVLLALIGLLTTVACKKKSYLSDEEEAALFATPTQAETEQILAMRDIGKADNLKLYTYDKAHTDITTNNQELADRIAEFLAPI